MSNATNDAAVPLKRTPPPTAYRWIVLFFISLPMFGNYYIYDAINPLLDIFKEQLSFNDTDLGWLATSYSIAALATLVIAGLLIDRFGTAKSIVLFSSICFLSSVVMVLEGSFVTMVTGRAILGLGAESLIVAVTTGLAKWFKGRELGFAFGVNLTVARLGSIATDYSPQWGRPLFYPDGVGNPASWQGPLWLGVVAGSLCLLGALVYWYLEKNAERRYDLGKADAADRLDFKSQFRFGRSYWYVVVLCFAFYSAIFPFRYFAIKFFMHTHFADMGEDVARETAGFFNSGYVFAAMILTPLFGLLVDRVGRRALFMALGSLLIMPVYLMMVYSDITLYVPVAMIGIAFSLIPAVLWPSVAYLVPERRLGVAYALMTFLQQIGMALLPLLLGWANDAAGASAQNPMGYAPGMWILSSLGVVGLVFACLLWRSEKAKGAEGLEAARAR